MRSLAVILVLGLGACSGAGHGLANAPAGVGAAFADAPDYKASGFDGGTIAPFTICTTQSPNFGQVVTLNGAPCMEFYWTQTAYNGTRMTRGAEACSSLQFTKEGWYGLQFCLPSSAFPTDKTQGIAQIFAMGGCTSWAALLQVRNNALWIVHRGNCVATPEYQVKLLGDIPRDQWNSVIIHFVASNQSAGLVEVWLDDTIPTPAVPTYRKTGINFAFGTWVADALVNVPTNTIGLKFGMYNFDDGNYTIGESRTIFFDNVSQLVGNPTDAFARVNPTR
jgi:hypothetical protein